MKKLLLASIMLLSFVIVFGQASPHSIFVNKIKNAHFGLTIAGVNGVGISTNINHLYLATTIREHGLKGSDFSNSPNWHNYGNWRETNRSSNDASFEVGIYSPKLLRLSIIPYIGIISRSYYSEYYNGNTHHFTHSKEFSHTNDFLYGCGLNYVFGKNLNYGILAKVTKEYRRLDKDLKNIDDIKFQIGMSWNISNLDTYDKQKKLIKYGKELFVPNSLNKKRKKELSNSIKIPLYLGSGVGFMLGASYLMNNI